MPHTIACDSCKQIRHIGNQSLETAGVFYFENCQVIKEYLAHSKFLLETMPSNLDLLLFDILLNGTTFFLENHGILLTPNIIKR